MTKTPTCTVLSETGVPCRKPLYHAQNGEYWDHPGGHLFMTEDVYNRLQCYHVDAKALLSDLPAASHSPEECTGEGFCSWRKLPEDRYV